MQQAGGPDYTGPHIPTPNTMIDYYIVYDYISEGSVSIPTCNEHNYALLQQFEESHVYKQNKMMSFFWYLDYTAVCL